MSEGCVYYHYPIYLFNRSPISSTDVCQAILSFHRLQRACSLLKSFLLFFLLSLHLATSPRIPRDKDLSLAIMKPAGLLIAALSLFAASVIGAPNPDRIPNCPGGRDCVNRREAQKDGDCPGHRCTERREAQIEDDNQRHYCPQRRGRSGYNSVDCPESPGTQE